MPDVDPRAVFSPLKWKMQTGAPLACREKIKVMDEGLEEVHQTLTDFFEDGVIMGCDINQMRQVLHSLVDDLENPFGQSDHREKAEKED